MLTAIGTFGLLGTVSVLWENPLFVRMTPVVGFEYVQLTALSLLCGLYVIVRRPFCSNKSAGVGAVLGLTGIACPVCNKVLLVLFGSELLLAYFEPIRLEVGFIGIAIVGAAVFWELCQRRFDNKTAGQQID